ncbi:FAD dependent oxidoreductase [Fusarium phyllophilum]|uniref:FAD dependent oxidoreductase n=1 Tax=Fusarium phyllophilum TaxID=47803 RepID=A0A8H5ID74_9HYPO|nr:FAD dependent oxidoreductase [Fusarium phyllophilum]
MRFSSKVNQRDTKTIGTMAPRTFDRSPVANPTSSFWNAEPKKLDDYRSSPQLPTKTDIVIIGSGLSGVATAYFILKDNPQPPSIVLLEARKICSGATGRNGGHVKPDTFSDIPKFVKLFGSAATAELAEFEAAHVFAVKDLVESENIECDFHLTRALDVYLDEKHADEVRTTYKDLSQKRNMNLADVAFIDDKDAERVSGVKEAKCCISYTAAHLWPSKLVHELLNKVIKGNLNIQAHTPVVSVTPCKDVEHGAWAVSTPRGSVQTSKVIYATNAYTSQILPEYARAITPVRGVCSHIKSVKGTATPHLVNTYGIRFDKYNNDYLIPRADGSIIVGGARQAFWTQKDRWFNNVRDDELVEEAVPYFDNYMQRHFRGWENSEMKTDKVWTGILGYSADFMPHIGQIPGKTGQFIIAGFTGYGMPKILLSSKGLAQMVRDNATFEQTGLPRVFKTTKERNESKSSPLEESLASLWTEKSKL